MTVLDTRIPENWDDRTYISDGLWVCILLELEEDRVGYGEVKGRDGPVSMEGIEHEPEGQQSHEAEGHETRDGIPHLWRAWGYDINKERTGMQLIRSILGFM